MVKGRTEGDYKGANRGRIEGEWRKRMFRCGNRHKSWPSAKCIMLLLFQTFKTKDVDDDVDG
jgi:hypothetical protein